MDVLSLWSATDDGAEIAFDAGDGAAPSACWRLDLPAGDAPALTRLQAIDAGLGALDRASTQAGPRLRRLVAIGDLSFDIASGPRLPAAEAALLADLGAMEPDPDLTSFGLADRLPSWDRAGAEVERLLLQALHLVSHYAWVETAVEGRLIGRTTVDWLGGMRTLWPLAESAEAKRRHYESLRLSLAARAATLRLVAVVTTGAITLVPLLSAPGAAVLALPAAWRFVQRLRAEVNRDSNGFGNL